MPIPKAMALAQFEDIQRPSCHRFKKMSRKKLVRMLTSSSVPMPLPPVTTLRKHQLAMIAAAASVDFQGLLFGDMGVGKALKNGTPVLTPNGWRPVENVVVGDWVYGRDGRPVRVLGVFPQGERDTYEVRFRDDSSVEVDGDHLWAVHSPVMKRRDKPNKVKTTKELLDGGLVDAAGNARWYVPTADSVELPVIDPPIDPYALGLLLGDGGMSRPHGSVGFCNPERDLVRALADRVRPLDCKVVPIGDRGMDYRVTRCASSGQNKLMQALRGLHLMGKLSIDKHIPDVYLRSSCSQRLELLMGLLDTDGGMSSNSLCFYTSSVKLKEGVVELVQSLGGTACSSYKECTKSWTLTIRMPPQLGCPFRCKRKARSWKKSNTGSKYGPVRPIVSITPSGRSHCTCISVEAEDGLFVTKDFIVTHNTTVSLTMIAWMREAGHGPAVVLVPNSGNVWDWLDQTAEHWPSLRIATLDDQTSSAKKKERFYDGDHDFVVSTYAGLRAVIGKDRDSFLAARKKYSQLYADECTHIRNKQTVTHKLVRDLTKDWPIRIGLTGSPVGRDAEALWGQFYIVDRGATLHKNIGVYRAAFFRRVEDPFAGERWEFEKKRKRKLNAVVRTGSIRYSKAECVDLPDKIVVSQNFSITSEQRKHIESLKEKARENPEDASKAFVRCRQAASGLLVLENDEKIRFRQNPRLDATLAWVQEMGSEPCVIFHEFKESGQWIEDALFELGRRPVSIRGGKSGRRQSLSRFRTGDSDTMVVQIQSGAYGLNLQRARYSLFYEPHCDPIVVRQAQDRIHRIGQEQKVTITNLVAHGTVDERILQYNEEGKNLHNAIIEGEVSL